MTRIAALIPALRVIALCVAVPALAQSSPKVELSAGYQFLNSRFDGDDQSMPKGWYADVAGNVNRTIGIVVQVGGNYKSFEESSFGQVVTVATDLMVHEFLAGVRVSARSASAITPFGHLLAGGINGSADVTTTFAIPGRPPVLRNEDVSSTNFALEVGGGMNVALSEMFGVRVGVDYLRVFGENSGANLLRFTSGFVVGR